MIHYDSREVVCHGGLWFSLPGGEIYRRSLLSKGFKGTMIRCTRKEMAIALTSVYRHPSKDLCVIGVTGTNGKTTVCHIIHHVLNEKGYVSDLLGTINSKLTTPEFLDTMTIMERHRRLGGTHFVMEVSSHGISQDRIWGIDFDFKLLTNVTSDHLDYHQTEEAYRQTKYRFLSDDYPGVSISPEHYKKEPCLAIPSLSSAFNQENLQAAITVLKRCGMSIHDIESSLKTFKPVKGRFSELDFGQDFKVIIDFAHNPDSLRVCLIEAKRLAQQGRLLLLFGCGGDRDKTKRAPMGRIASDIADLVILTQDNSRTESPLDIIRDIKLGITDDTTLMIELDRELAINKILSMAKKGDVVVLAGKGHETEQILGNTSHHFDEVDIVKRFFSTEMFT